jgi:hypothetical protein
LGIGREVGQVGGRGGGLPYNLAYKTPLCGRCETNALSQGGYYRKGIYYGRWSVRHTNFAATLRQGGYYMRGGLIAKGGLICQIIRCEDTFVAVEREITPEQAVEGQSVGLASVLVERDW